MGRIVPCAPTDLHNLMASHYSYEHISQDATNKLQLNSKLGEESGGNARFLLNRDCFSEEGRFSMQMLNAAAMTTADKSDGGQHVRAKK